MTTRPIRNAVEGMVVILRFCRAKGHFNPSWIVRQANLQTEIINCCNDRLVAIGEGYQWTIISLETLKPILEIERVSNIEIHNFVQQKLYPLYLKKEESINYE